MQKTILKFRDNPVSITAITTSLTLLGVLTVTTSEAQGASLAITNASFEEPVFAEDGDFTTDIPPGWILDDPLDFIPPNPAAGESGAGTFDPPIEAFFDEAPEGRNTGYIFLLQPPGSGGASFIQTLDDVLTAETMYTLKVDVGDPLAYDTFTPVLGGFPGYRIELLADETVLAADDNSLRPDEGTFETSFVSFVASSDHPNLGDPLQIRLVNPNVAPGVEVDFDNVRLSATPVPEASSTFSLIFLGFGAGLTLKKKNYFWK